MSEPCENCEVLRIENRGLQRALENARTAADAAAAKMRAAMTELAVQKTIEALQTVCNQALAQLTELKAHADEYLPLLQAAAQEAPGPQSGDTATS